MHAIVCWYVLATGVPVCSAPLPYREALMVFQSGAQSGTSMPSVFKDDTSEYREWVVHKRLTAVAQKDARW
jgi:hypothetical protein